MEDPDDPHPRLVADELWEVVFEESSNEPFFFEVPLDPGQPGSDFESPCLGIATRRAEFACDAPDLRLCVAGGLVKRLHPMLGWVRLEALEDLSDCGSCFVAAGVSVDATNCVAFYRQDDGGAWDCTGRLASVPLAENAPRVVLARRAGGANVSSLLSAASLVRFGPFEPRARTQEHWKGDSTEPWWECVIWRRDLQALEAALHTGANLGAKNAAQDTEVHLSARRGWVMGLQLLLAVRADVAALNMFNRTPLLEAARAGFASAAAVLLEAGACVDFQGGRTWEQRACELVRVREDRAALHHAAESGHRRMLILLLSARASVDLVDALGCSPLALAARAGQWATVAVLLEAKADPNLSPKTGGARGEEASLLHLAALRGEPQLASLLLAASASPRGAWQYGAGAAGFRPLHLAARGRTASHAEVVVALLQARADANALTPGGKTAAELAVLNRASAETLRALRTPPADRAPVTRFQDLSPKVRAEFFLDE